MKFKKKILCLLSLFLIYKVFIYNNDFFVERLNEVKDYVIEQASIMINGHDLIDEYDSSDVESSFLKNKDNYTPNDDAENKVFNSISEASSYAPVSSLPEFFRIEASTYRSESTATFTLETPRIW